MSWYQSDEHEHSCENAEYFKCIACNIIVHETERNQCPNCKLFIPRIFRCVCEDLENIRHWREVSYA